MALKWKSHQQIFQHKNMLKITATIKKANKWWKTKIKFQKPKHNYKTIKRNKNKMFQENKSFLEIKMECYNMKQRRKVKYYGTELIEIQFHFMPKY